MMSAIRLTLIVPLLALTACGSRVDCEKLCARTLACAVTFMVEPASATVDGGAATNGLEECTAGCENDPRVTIEAASCIDNVKVGDPAQCQEPVLGCLGLDQSGLD